SMSGKPTLLGKATDRLISPAAANVSLGWAQSQSWVRPIGVFPDTDVQTVTMKTMGPSGARTNPNLNTYGDGNANKLCACIMTHLDTKYNDSTTLAHELGHVLGLNHRGSGGNPADKKSTDGV